MKEKEIIRQRIWKLMEERGIARFPLPIQGRIPNFVGARKAALNLRKLKEYQNAKIIIANPDSPQQPVRELALKDEKLLYASPPGLKKSFFLELDPEKLPKGSEQRASTIGGSFKFGKRVEVDEMKKIDLIIVGCVAVTLNGAKLGKGKGYSDLCFAIFTELGLFDEKTPVVTTVHPIQIVDSILMTEHDLPIDFIVTPQKTYRTNTEFKKPLKVDWSLVDSEKLRDTPLLQRLKKTK